MSIERRTVEVEVEVEVCDSCGRVLSEGHAEGCPEIVPYGSRFVRPVMDSQTAIDLVALLARLELGYKVKRRDAEVAKIVRRLVSTELPHSSRGGT